MRKTYYKILTKALSRFLRSPQFLILYLTSDCWMKCRHCFYNESFREKNNIRKESLTFDELKKLSESIKKILYLSFAGGEPFIREDLEEIVKLFTWGNKVFRYQMPTSGYMTSMIIEKTERILKDNPGIPFRIHVSLDGNKEAHEEIRLKKGSFENAVETIKELNNLKKSFSYFDVSLVTTICNYNQNVVDELCGIVEEIHPEGEWCINLIRGEARNPKAMEVEAENYSKVNRLIDRRIKEGSYKGYSGHLTSKWLSAKNAARRNIINKIMNNGYRGGGCSAGSLGGVIYPDGSVYACELLNKSLGSLSDHDFNLPSLWNSSNADQIRNWIQDTECICTHECVLSTNILIQPRAWPSLLAERLKLFRNG